jgi:hypothetical protein
VKEGEYGGSTMYSCENGTMRPVEIVLRRGREDKEESWRG